MSDPHYRLVIADDHPLFRGALREAVAGLIERLGSGQKRSFDTGEQLVRLVGGGFALELNMQPTNGDRNAGEGDTTGPSLDDGI